MLLREETASREDGVVPRFLAPAILNLTDSWEPCVMGKALIILGILLLIGGIALSYAPWLFSWFGKLPGDIRIERENGVFFFPITSMLLISVVLSLVLSLFFRR